MPDQLKELQRLFAEAVLVTGPYTDEHGYPPPGYPMRITARGCWFQEHMPDIDPCGGGRPGVLEAAHWIKRQQVERWVRNQLRVSPYDLAITAAIVDELIAIAAWDPRNAVPACEHHHRRFDGHRVPLPREQLIVPRLLVPAHVLEFSEDYGMETFIEDKHPLEV